MIADHFGTMKSAAEQLSTSSSLMAAPVANYRTSTVDISNQITGEVNTLLIETGVIAAAAVAASWLSFGGSLAAGTAGITGAVTTTVNTIRGLYQASRLYRLLGVTALAATAVGVVKEFDSLPDLNPITTALAGIIALRATMDDDAGTAKNEETGAGSSGPTKESEVRDIVNSRTVPGNNKPHRQLETDEEIRQLYEDLTVNGKPVDVGSYPGRASELSDGTMVRIRDTSTSGGVTLDITYPNGRQVKVHLPKP